MVASRNPRPQAGVTRLLLDHNRIAMCHWAANDEERRRRRQNRGTTVFPTASAEKGIRKGIGIWMGRLCSLTSERTRNWRGGGQ
jgi:hypothetical protein